MLKTLKFERLKRRFVMYCSRDTNSGVLAKVEVQWNEEVKGEGVVEKEREEEVEREREKIKKWRFKTWERRQSTEQVLSSTAIPDKRSVRERLRSRRAALCVHCTCTRYRAFDTLDPWGSYWFPLLTHRPWREWRHLRSNEIRWDENGVGWDGQSGVRGECSIVQAVCEKEN
jgi:hypothetical protein